MSKFDPIHHNRAKGMSLVEVVGKNNVDGVSEYWLDPDGVHLHALWNITKQGAADRRARPQSLLRRLAPTKFHPEGELRGWYVLATPENLARLRQHEDKITALKMALDRAVNERDSEMAMPGGAS
jgi:hypothetical protein